VTEYPIIKPKVLIRLSGELGAWETKGFMLVMPVMRPKEPYATFQ